MVTVATRPASSSVTANPVATRFQTAADLLQHLGDVPAGRVRLEPVPGTATEHDVVTVHERENRLCELVDGVLVEKVMGFDESICALLLASSLVEYLKAHDLGKVVGADGMMRLFPGQVRIPDVAFISWKRYPKGKRRRGEIPTVAPDLVVEILSKGNTSKEMKRKLEEYFQAGVRLVWYVNPAARTVRVYTGPKKSVLLNEAQELSGGAVLPGFTLSIRDWFTEAQRSAAKS